MVEGIGCRVNAAVTRAEKHAAFCGATPPTPHLLRAPNTRHAPPSPCFPVRYPSIWDWCAQAPAWKMAD